MMTRLFTVTVVRTVGLRSNKSPAAELPDFPFDEMYSVHIKLVE